MTRLLALLFTLVAALGAQPRDMFPWWETPLVRDLNLSDDQMKQIQSIVKENRDKLVDLRAAVEKADHGVNDLMNDERPELAKFTAALDRQSAARSELAKTFSLMGFKIRLVLTAQQWRELQKRRAQRTMDDPNRGLKKGFPGRPAGGGPPGGPQDRPPRPQGPPPAAGPPPAEGPPLAAGPPLALDGVGEIPFPDSPNGRNI